MSKFKKFSPEQIKQQKPSINEVRKAERMPFYLILDNIRSLHNVGAIFRTADAIMAKKLYLCGITGHPTNPPQKELSKTALGALDVVPWEYLKSTLDVVKQLKNAGITIYALELTEKSVNYKKVDIKFPAAMIVGNEVDGITEEVLDLADYAIDIPMKGRANSLNVSTACGIAAFEFLYKYEQKT
ncbi:TrmH family RNA methyltransferase [Candidatus Peregrinibacteria bacterium]|nr:TrmH family RNA methyltransferase [Candidatus Peregrinibacteria bacterium]